MGQQWDVVRMARKLLAFQQRDFWAYKGRLRDFRRKWTNNPPDVERDWFTFWRELKNLEDDVDAVQENLGEALESLHEAIDAAAEIFRLNKLEQVGDDPIASMRQALKRVEALMAEPEE